MRPTLSLLRPYRSTKWAAQSPASVAQSGKNHMEIIKTGAVALAATALLLAAPSANADVNATATLSGLRYELFDLDANDGIAANITFGQRLSSNYSNIRTLNSVFLQRGFSYPDNIINTPDSRAEVHQYSSTSIFATSSTTVGSGEYAQASASSTIDFELGAGSGVRWYADSTVHGSIDNDFGKSKSIAISAIQLFYLGNNVVNEWLINQWNNVSSYSETGSLMAQVTNSGSDVVSYRGWATAGAIVSSDFVMRATTAPVPEPETYAMMLAGLGLVSTIARRRKTKVA